VSECVGVSSKITSRSDSHLPLPARQLRQRSQIVSVVQQGIENDRMSHRDYTHRHSYENVHRYMENRGMEFDQLILRRIVKIVATKCQILRLNCTKIDFGWGSGPDPVGGGGTYSAPRLPSWI